MMCKVTMGRPRHDHTALLEAMQAADLFEVVVAENDVPMGLKAKENICRRWNSGYLCKQWSQSGKTWFRPMKHGYLYLFVRVE